MPRGYSVEMDQALEMKGTKMATRDLTKAQFDAACARHGFRHEFMGYYNVGHGLSVYARNAGDNRRAQLAYLIREAQKAERKADANQ
jgi:hypothetical protein